MSLYGSWIYLDSCVDFQLLIIRALGKRVQINPLPWVLMEQLNSTLFLIGRVRMTEKAVTKGDKLRLRPDTIVIAGFGRLPQNITGKSFSNYIAIEFEIEPTNSKVVDIYCTLLPFVEKEILYKACLGNKIEAGIEKAIEQLDKRFFGATKRAMITALEDALKRHKKVHKQNSGFGDQRQSHE